MQPKMLVFGDRILTTLLKRRFNMKIERKAVTPEQAAAIYGLSLGTLANLRSKRAGAKFYRQNRRIYYKIEDLESWLFREPIMTTDAHEAKK
jgi:hypothetical protein